MGLGSHPSARLAAAQLAAVAALINDCRRPIKFRGRPTECCGRTSKGFALTWYHAF